MRGLCKVCKPLDTLYSALAGVLGVAGFEILPRRIWSPETPFSSSLAPETWPACVIFELLMPASAYSHRVQDDAVLSLRGSAVPPLEEVQSSADKTMYSVLQN